MEGKSTLGGLDIWYDESVGRLNRDERGRLLGNFQADDKILVVYHSGEYELTSFDLTNRYEPNKMAMLAQFDPKGIIGAVHMDGESGLYYVKRFQVETTTMDKKFLFINESKGSKLVAVTQSQEAQIELTYTIKGSRERHKSLFDLDMIIDVKGWKATGNKLSPHRVQKVKFINPEGTTSEVKEEAKPVINSIRTSNDASKPNSSDKSKIEEAKAPLTELKTKQTNKDKGDHKEGGGAYNVGDTIELF
jgi:topoisomerase-4 subunit A